MKLNCRKRRKKQCLFREPTTRDEGYYLLMMPFGRYQEGEGPVPYCGELFEFENKTYYVYHQEWLNPHVGRYIGEDREILYVWIRRIA